MGLLSLSPAYRFLDGLSADQLESNARILFASFLEAMKAESVCLPSTSPAMKATAERLLPSDMLTALDDWGANEEKEFFPAKDSVDAFSARMRDLPQMPNVSGGISFGIDGAPTSPGNRWHAMLHRGPLPLLEIEISDGAHFAPPPGWEERLVNTGSAHVVWTSRKKYLGMAANVYLLQKQRTLFPYSKGRSSEDATGYGSRLRQLCYDTWARQKNKGIDLCELPPRGWRHRRFLRRFDELLLSRVGEETLSEIFVGMGTDLHKWRQAGQT